MKRLAEGHTAKILNLVYEPSALLSLWPPLCLWSLEHSRLKCWPQECGPFQESIGKPLKVSGGDVG